MTSQSKLFTYSEIRNQFGEVRRKPLLAVQFTLAYQVVQAYGLIDSGADINVLPYQLGLELGAVWEDHPSLGGLGGNLADYETRSISLLAHISTFRPVRLLFYWTSKPDTPLIFGQYNFFDVFNVSFYRSQNAFELQPSMPR
jgi:hypothetical protein